MKITRIYTINAIMSKDHKYIFDKNAYKLEYLPKLNMFSIDGTLIPHSNIREVITEAPEIEMVEVDTSLLDSPVADRSFSLESDFFLETRFKDEKKLVDKAPSSPEILEDWFLPTPGKGDAVLEKAPPAKAKKAQKKGK